MIAHTAEVVGSNPIPPTISKRLPTLDLGRIVLESSSRFLASVIPLVILFCRSAVQGAALPRLCLGTASGLDKSGTQRPSMHPTLQWSIASFDLCQIGRVNIHRPPLAVCRATSRLPSLRPPVCSLPPSRVPVWRVTLGVPLQPQCQYFAPVTSDSVNRLWGHPCRAPDAVPRASLG